MFSLFPERPVAVRVLRPADAAGVAALHSASFRHGWSIAEIEAMLRDRAVTGHAIGAGSRLDGFALSRRAADEAEILTIAVAARRQGRGLGRKLLEAHLGGLAAAGARAVFLEVEEGNTPAIALYRRHGFGQVGLRKSYYRRADGSAANALVLRLALE
jgi:ribosomal-protein-alanine N-acetyltransferase